MMQAIFRLPWSTEHVGDRELKTTSCPPRQQPMVQIPAYNGTKRKRDDAADASANLVSPKRRKAEPPTRVGKSKHALGTQSQTQSPHMPAQSTWAQTQSQMQHMPQATVNGVAASHSPGHGRESQLQEQDSRPSSMERSKMRGNTEVLQKTVEAQFSLEILLKHRELRLIEQELAKCQVALEQLRRCRIIPYPGNDSLSVDMSGGVGPAIEPASGLPRPSHAAPWGVTDGPYTKHYAKWLISDPRFDAVPDQAPIPLADQNRATRGSAMSMEHRSTGGKRASRNSTAGPLQSIPTQYHTPKEKSGGPVVVHRASDNSYVKLVCTDCSRSDFSSAQGFLNHCRIAHHRDYKSHEQAALACGQALGDGEEPGPGASAHDAVAAPAPTGNSKHHEPAPPASTPLVHPFNRSGSLNLPHLKTPKPRKPTSTTITTLRSFKPFPSSLNSAPFQPAPQTPHLSALLRRAGFAGDIASIVAAAQAPVDWSALDAAGDEGATSDDDAVAQHTESTRSGAGTRPVSRQAPAPLIERPSSRKGFRQPLPSGGGVIVQIPPRVVAKPNLRKVNEAPETESPVDLSPHTLESNPGLVSDREEDDVMEDGDDESVVLREERVDGVGVVDEEHPPAGVEETPSQPGEKKKEKRVSFAAEGGRGKRQRRGRK